VPPIVFAVMPMFAWHAFRGSLREATLLLTLVGFIGTGFTMAGIGPIHGLGTRYDLAPELVSGVLQLFILDCGLILLPLSVMVTQHRIAAARADAERETLKRLVASATGTAIIAMGADGRIEVFNPGAEQMLGWSAEEALGELPDVLIPDDELRAEALALRALPNFADICRASVALGDTHRLWWFRRSDGEQRSMRMTLSAIPDDSVLLRLLGSVPARSLLLLEDIDIVHGAKKRDDGEPGVSLSGLLNGLDGVITPHGLVTVLTTNDASKLDEALLREGRVDVTAVLDVVDDEQLRRLAAFALGDSFMGRGLDLPALRGRRLTPAEVMGAFRRHLGDNEAAMVDLKRLIVD